MVDESSTGDPTLKVSIDAKGAKKGANEAASAINKLKKSAKEADKGLEKTNKVLDKSKKQFRNLASSVAVVDGPLGGVASRINAFGTIMGRVTPTMLAFTAVLIGVSAIVRSSIKAFIPYEQAINRLQSVFEATGRAAEISTDQFDQFAIQLGRDTLTSRQAVLDAGASLATFSNIATKDFQKVLGISQDLAAVFGGDLKSNSQLLARALQAPGEAFTILERRVGKFTQVEKDLLKALQDTGNIAEAQALIFEKLGVVQDAATKEAESLAGALDTSGEAFADFGIQMVETTGIADEFKSTLEATSSVLDFFTKTIKESTDRGVIGRFSEKLLEARISFNLLTGDMEEAEELAERYAKRLITRFSPAADEATKSTNELAEEVAEFSKKATEAAEKERKFKERTAELKIELEKIKFGGLTKAAFDFRKELEKISEKKLLDLRTFGSKGAEKSLLELQFLVENNAEAFKELGEEGKNTLQQIIADSQRLKELQESADIAKPIRDYVEASQFGLKQANELIVSSADDIAVALTDPWEKGETVAIRAGNVISSILRDIALQMIRLSVTSPLASSLSAFFGGFFSDGAAFNNGNVIPSAAGNSFSGGKVIPHADGDVVDQFSAFPMAGGNIGTIAENNKPEAILPLKRNSSGKLGVIAQGAGASSIQNNINVVVEGGAAQGSEVELGRRIASEVEIKVQQRMVEFLKQQTRIGGMLNEGVTA